MGQMPHVSSLLLNYTVIYRQRKVISSPLRLNHKMEFNRMNTQISPTISRRTWRGSQIIALLVVLPALFFPPFSILPGANYMNNVISIIDFATRFGGVGWRLVTYIRALLTDPANAGDSLVLLLPCCVALLVLALCASLGWRWFVERERSPRLTRLRALGIMLVMTIVSAIITGLLNIALLMVMVAIPGSTEGQGFGMLYMVFITVLGHLAFFPLLLIAGVLLARRQMRAV
jgi:hypothetical protein